MSEEEKQAGELELLGGKKRRMRTKKRVTKRAKHNKSKKITHRRKHKRH